MSARARILAAFVLLAIVQLAVIGSRIVKWETVMRTGKEYKFRAAPVDPADPFRGRYVALAYEAASVPRDQAPNLRSHQEAFALLGVDRDGFAEIKALASEPPADADFVRVRIGYVSHVRPLEQKEISLDLPFERFYVPEEIAPAAEKAYGAASARDKKDAYAVVRVKDGYGVIEDLFIGGEPIREFLRRARPAPGRQEHED